MEKLFIFQLIWFLPELHFYQCALILLAVLLFKNRLVWEGPLQLTLLFPFYLRCFVMISINPHSSKPTCLFLISVTFFLSSRGNIFNLKSHNFPHILYAKLLISLYHDSISFSLTKLYGGAFYENLFLFLIYRKSLLQSPLFSLPFLIQLLNTPFLLLIFHFKCIHQEFFPYLNLISHFTIVRTILIKIFPMIYSFYA